MIFNINKYNNRINYYKINIYNRIRDYNYFKMKIKN